MTEAERISILEALERLPGFSDGPKYDGVKVR
jgi:hypothetical protein